MLKKFKAKKEIVKFFDKQKTIKLIEEHGESFKYFGKQIKFDNKLGIKFLDLKPVFVGEESDLLNTPEDNSLFVDRDIEIKTWNPKLFNNKVSVMYRDSIANTELRKVLYEQQLEKLKRDFPDFDWNSLVDNLQEDLGQILRHLLLTFKFLNGSRMMIHFTHSSEVDKVLMLENRNISIHNIPTQEINNIEYLQYIANPTQISEEFYERVFNIGIFMENVTDSVSSKLNEEILLKLGVSSNEELGERILYFIGYLDSFHMYRGIEMYETKEILEDYCGCYEINDELSAVLNKIFYLYINGK